MTSDGKFQRERRTFQRRIPVGLEQVLFLAASDGEFRAALLEDRVGALDRWGLRLRDSEVGMLGHIPDAQLQANIAAVDTSAPNLQRREFLRSVAASVAALATGGTMSGCSDVDAPGPNLDMGIRDISVTSNDAGVDMGVRPRDMSFEAEGFRPDMGMDSRPPDAPKVEAGSDLVMDVPSFSPDRGSRPFPDKSLKE